ncbi:MAG TPA: efflux RND transporter periplasmic adaptor subunit [Candidatus Eisenbacteria bacterium]|nr:efflux RND transporter periplasmic adaptor subunit [Candidatus Eisenbacteria bacterium]
MATEEELSGGHEPRGKKSSLFTVFFAIVAGLIVLATILILQRRAQYRALANDTELAAVPTVAIIHPEVEAGDEDLVLPGTLQAYVESPIYARTNGYLKKWYYDIGSSVKKGELLADIDTPEVDQQLRQARADLDTSNANVQLSQITAARYSELLKTDGVSKQEVDNAVGDLAAKRAMVESAEANVRRLEDLESFKRIYAPFNGVITQRNIDIGTLINAGNGGTSQQLFYLAQTDPIRVYVNVPEAYAPSIHPGIGAYLELTQYPGQKFHGKVVRSANAINLSTRTLVTEVDVPNATGQLLPGGYAQVHLEVKVKGERLQVPVNSLLFRREGLRAVVVDAEHRAHLQTLTIGRDYGVTLEVLNGLKADDWIVLNPPDSLNDGEQVHVKEVANPMAPPPTAETPPARPGNATAPAGKKP